MDFGTDDQEFASESLVMVCENKQTNHSNTVWFAHTNLQASD